mgnify:CR=1 FL=1
MADRPNSLNALPVISAAKSALRFVLPALAKLSSITISEPVRDTETGCFRFSGSMVFLAIVKMGFPPLYQLIVKF